MPLYAVALRFAFIGAKGPSPLLFQHGNDHVHKTNSTNTWFAKVSQVRMACTFGMNKL